MSLLFQPSISMRIAIVSLIGLTLFGAVSCRPRESVSENPLREVFAYIPAYWYDTRLDGSHSMIAIAMDFEKLRNESSSLVRNTLDSGDTSAYLTLSQGLRIGVSPVDPFDPSFETRWGFGIDEIRQGMFVPDLNLSILRGVFSDEGIANRLKAQGIASRDRGDGYAISEQTQNGWIIAFNNEFMIAARRLELVEQMLQRKTGPLKMRTDMTRMLDEMAGEAGFVFITPGDLSAIEWSKPMVDRLNAFSGAAATGNRYYPWSILTMAFEPSTVSSRFRLRYFYDDGEFDPEDIALSSHSILNTVSILGKGDPLPEIEISDSSWDGYRLLIEGTSSDPSLLGKHVHNRDIYRFLFARLAAGSDSEDKGLAGDDN